MKETTIELTLERIDDENDDDTEHDGRLTVFTTDGDGDPLDGVNVVAESSDGAFGSTQTFEGVTQTGAVAIELPVADYSVSASKDGYADAQGSVAAEDFA